MVFGQETGDHLLQAIAAQIGRQLRGSDVLARTDGEEFLMILPDSDVTAARLVAERIRQSLAERPLLADNQRIPVTASLGVAALPGKVELDALAGEAQRAMRLAKQSGRNQVASIDPKPILLTSGAS